MLDILKEIREEREHQDRKWGKESQNLHIWTTILGEEMGEVNRAVLESDMVKYREELVQVAAVAIAMIEDINDKPPKGDEE